MAQNLFLVNYILIWLLALNVLQNALQDSKMYLQKHTDSKIEEICIICTKADFKIPTVRLFIAVSNTGLGQDAHNILIKALFLHCGIVYRYINYTSWNDPFQVTTYILVIVLKLCQNTKLLTWSVEPQVKNKCINKYSMKEQLLRDLLIITMQLSKQFPCLDSIYFNYFLHGFNSV